MPYFMQSKKGQNNKSETVIKLGQRYVESPCGNKDYFVCIKEKEYIKEIEHYVFSNAGEI